MYRSANPARSQFLSCAWNYRPDFCFHDVYDCERCGATLPKLLHGARGAFHPRTRIGVLCLRAPYLG